MSRCLWVITVRGRRPGAYPPTRSRRRCALAARRHQQDHRHAMPPGGECQPPCGGEVRCFDFRDHQAHGAGDNRFLNRPERITQRAHLGVQPRRWCTVHLAQCRFRHTPQIAAHLRLIYPQPCPAPRLPGRGQNKARDRAAVSIRGLCNLVQAADAKPVWKRRRNGRRSRHGPQKAPCLECGYIHNVLILFFCDGVNACLVRTRFRP